MTDLPARIAALPEWPKDIERVGPFKRYKDHDYTVYDDGRSAETPYQTDLAEAALARLALAREWIETAHGTDCAMYPDTEGNAGWKCTCGRDALLKALEQPQ